MNSQNIPELDKSDSIPTKKRTLQQRNKTLVPEVPETIALQSGQNIDQEIEQRKLKRVVNGRRSKGVIGSSGVEPKQSRTTGKSSGASNVEKCYFSQSHALMSSSFLSRSEIRKRLLTPITDPNIARQFSALQGIPLNCNSNEIKSLLSGLNSLDTTNTTPNGQKRSRQSRKNPPLKVGQPDNLLERVCYLRVNVSDKKKTNKNNSKKKSPKSKIDNFDIVDDQDEPYLIENYLKNCPTVVNLRRTAFGTIIDEFSHIIDAHTLFLCNSCKTVRELVDFGSKVSGAINKTCSECSKQKTLQYDKNKSKMRRQLQKQNKEFPGNNLNPLPKKRRAYKKCRFNINNGTFYLDGNYDKSIVDLSILDDMSEETSHIHEEQPKQIEHRVEQFNPMENIPNTNEETTNQDGLFHPEVDINKSTKQNLKVMNDLPLNNIGNNYCVPFLSSNITIASINSNKDNELSTDSIINTQSGNNIPAFSPISQNEMQSSFYINQSEKNIYDTNQFVNIQTDIPGGDFDEINNHQMINSYNNFLTHPYDCVQQSNHNINIYNSNVGQNIIPARRFINHDNDVNQLLESTQEMNKYINNCTSEDQIHISRNSYANNELYQHNDNQIKKDDQVVYQSNTNHFIDSNTEVNGYVHNNNINNNINNTINNNNNNIYNTYNFNEYSQNYGFNIERNWAGTNDHDNYSIPLLENNLHNFYTDEGGNCDYGIDISDSDNDTTSDKFFRRSDYHNRDSLGTDGLFGESSQNEYNEINLFGQYPNSHHEEDNDFRNFNINGNSFENMYNDNELFRPFGDYNNNSDIE